MNELDKLFDQAREDNLPQNFDRWDLKDERGISVAHVAAKHGHLPPEFDQWGLKDERGISVAHVAAKHGHLPPEFDQWGLKDGWGISVAHVAAKHGHLPPEFDQWGLKDGFGLSVAQEAGLRDGVHPLVMSRIKPEDLGKWFRTENYQNYLKSTRKPTSLDLVIRRMFERSR